MRRSINRMNTGTRRNEGDAAYKVEGGVYENTTETEPVGNNRQFAPLIRGNVFKINRPAFKYKDQKIPNDSVAMYKSKRTGTGNFAIKRSNFMSQPVRPRNVDVFEKMELQNLEDAGQPISLGDETLDKLFNVQIADPNDKEWLERKALRLGAGETEEQIAANPPFRREQRTITKRINFATQGLALQDKIELLQTAVASNNVESMKEIGEVATSISLILDKNISELNRKQEQILSNVINRLNIPANPLSAGLDHRIFSKEDYTKDVGVVNMFIYAKANSLGRDINNPVINAKTGKTIKLSSMVNMLSTGKDENSVYLDVDTLRLINKAEAISLRPDLANEEKKEEDEEEREENPFETNPTTTEFLGDTQLQ